MSYWDNLDGSDLYSSDMRSSTEKTKKVDAAPKNAEITTEALDLYLESDSARLMKTSIEKSTAPETQVEELREKVVEDKNSTLKSKDSKMNNNESTNQLSASATSTDGTTPAKTQNTQSANKNEKRAVILPSHAKQKGNASKKVAQYWQSEAAVDVDTRRQRYRNPYVTPEAVPTWEEYSRKLKPLDKAPLFSANEDINKKVSLFAGTVTQMEVDAIVNAANESCMGGAGVDGAVHQAAGKLLLEECKTLQGCQPGKAKITRGYNLPAQFVIHTVGPKNQNEATLRSCYQSCLELAVEYEIRTLAFCCVGVGIYGYPLPAATKVALDTVRKWIETEDNRNKMDKIIFVVFTDREKSCYEDLMPLYFPTSDQMAAFEEKDKQSGQKQEEELKKKLEKEREENAKQEEKLRQEQEQRREEERKKAEEETKKQEEKKKQEEQEKLRKEAEAKRIEEENRKKEQERQENERKQKEAKRQEEERKAKEEAERKQKEKERLEQERKQKERQLKEEEERKQKQAEANRVEEKKQKEQAEKLRKEAEAKRIEEENRKKEPEAKMKQEQAAKQMPSPAQTTPTPTPDPTPVPSQGMNPYLLVGGLIGTTLLGVAAFLLIKRH